MAEPPSAKPGPGPGENEGVNVQVLLRCRPLSDKEIAERTPQVISCNEALREATLYQNVGGKQMSRTFRFDRVFGCDSTQEKLFRQAVVPIVEEVMEGFNCTIFAYGQTGTGKTYTMEGGPRKSEDGKQLSAEAGVIPRSIKQIFDTIESNNADSTVKVTFLELYNEELTDLLSFDDAKDESKRLRLLEDRSGVVVQGLEEVVVKSATEIYQVLDRGTAKRRTAETLLNKRSSRSHSVFSITIHMREVTPEGEDVVKVGKLNLVDLAGSENISRSGAKDGRAREAGSINQSLLTLGRVITALVEHSGHVPYRDSKLTRLLRESLGGKTKTCIIATIAPTVQCQEETISTLDYAHRAKNIRNRPEVNQKISKTAMIKEMSSEMEKLRMELVAQREKNGVYIPIEQHQADELERVQLRDAVKNMREERQLEQEEFQATLQQHKAESERVVSRLESELARAKEEVAFFDQRLQEASRILYERQYVIRAQRQAEQELADHAEAVRNDLAAAVTHISGLFASLEELSDVHCGDRDTVKRVQKLIGDRLSALGSSLAGSVEGQQQQLAGMGEALAAFKAQKQVELEELTARMQAAQATLAEVRDAVARGTQAAEASSSSALGRARDGAATYAGSTVEAATALEAAARSAIEGLTASMEQQAQELQALVAQQATAAGAACDTLRSTMQRMSSGFDSLQAAAAEAQASISQRAAGLSSDLGSFADRYKQSCEAQQAQVMAQIGALMQSYTEQRVTALAQEVQRLQAAAKAGGEEASEQLGCMAQAATSAAQEARDAEVALPTSIQAAHQEAERRAGGLATSLGALQGQARSVHAGVAEGLKRSVAAAQSFSQGMGEECSRAAGSVQAAVRACTSEAGEAVSGASTAIQGVGQTVEAAAARDCRSAEEWGSACVAVGGALSALGEAQTSGMSSLAGEAEGLLQARLEVERQVLPPKQPELSVPPPSSIQELRCPSEERLTARCHEEFPQMFSGTTAAPASPRANVSRQPSGSAGAMENATPMAAVAAAGPLDAQGTVGGALIPPSPRSTAGLRSRIPSKPNLVPSSPASVKDLAPNVTTRQQLADKTNARSQRSLLSDWPA
ncbi:hypothetical protein HYH03_006891 [Edaphochlamys debaryana]|uniref:Kinesin motor domain-containing protein n=1 Tax=Edaphochlamys debaryana TaxID=47281 RepID=A0A835Y2W8_9CHLO|nr:hypothetical protein HYH03_006891 [Edaphochlamys debaryana]|eukprot:KAG2494956.1 hypothetical protein HYH03_006891 [Edaphochlamys debaryana]